MGGFFWEGVRELQTHRSIKDFCAPWGSFFFLRYSPLHGKLQRKLTRWRKSKTYLDELYVRLLLIRRFFTAKSFYVFSFFVAFSIFKSSVVGTAWSLMVTRVAVNFEIIIFHAE